jgi:exonuclease VII large subunit
MKPERNEYTAAESHAHLESENSRLQRLVAELLVRNQQLREQLEAASRSEKRHPSSTLDSAQDHLTYRTDNLSTRIGTARLRT